MNYEKISNSKIHTAEILCHLAAVFDSVSHMTLYTKLAEYILNGMNAS
jgi:hypothetical protein